MSPLPGPERVPLRSVTLSGGMVVVRSHDVRSRLSRPHPVLFVPEVRESQICLPSKAVQASQRTVFRQGVPGAERQILAELHLERRVEGLTRNTDRGDFLGRSLPQVCGVFNGFVCCVDLTLNAKIKTCFPRFQVARHGDPKFMLRRYRRDNRWTIKTRLNTVF